MGKFKEIELFFQKYIPICQKKKETKVFVVGDLRCPNGKSWIDNETEDSNEWEAHGEELLQPVSMNSRGSSKSSTLTRADGMAFVVGRSYRQSTC